MANNVTIKDGANADAVIATRDKGPSLGEVQYVQIDLGDAGAITPAEGTLPVSAAALPLPAGAATAANQATEIAALGAPTDAEATGDGPVIALLKRLRTLLGSVLQVSGTRSNAGTDTASGAAHLTVGGSDGTNLRPLLTDSGGRAVVSVNGTVPVSGPLTDLQLRAAAVPVSAASLPLPSGAALEAGGNLATLASRTPPLGQAAMAGSQPVVIASDQSVVAVNQSGVSATGTLGVVNATVALSLNGATGFAVDLRGAFVATVTFQGTVNGTDWVTLAVLPAGSGPNVATVTTATAVGAWTGNANGLQQVRAIATAYTSGTVNVTLRAMQAAGMVFALPSGQTTQAISGTVTANIGTGSLAAGTNAIGDVGIQYRANATGAGTPTNYASPATPAGASIKGSAGRLLALSLHNSSTGLRWVKFFNATTVTMGTTSAVFERPIPAGGTLEWNAEGGVGFATGIQIAVTANRGLTDNTATGLALGDVAGFTVHA